MPLVGPLLEPAGQIPLDRGASFAAIKALLREYGGRPCGRVARS